MKKTYILFLLFGYALNSFDKIHSKNNQLDQALLDATDPNGKQDINKIKSLIKNGADVNYAASNGVTPLENATSPWLQKPKIDVIKLLINSGAKINHYDINWTTPLLNAITGLNYCETNSQLHKDWQDIISLLKKHGAKVLSENKIKTIRK